MYDSFAQFMREAFRPGPDKSRAFGLRHTEWNGQVWEVVRQNDLGVPYFAKVQGDGTLSKTLYTLADGGRLALGLIAEHHGETSRGGDDHAA